MINRVVQNQLQELLEEVPAVALLGPRQVGKTTLAFKIAKMRPALYLDLESEADRNKLSDPELYLSEHENKLIILDEVHRIPNIFQSLRGLIDKGKRKGLKAGRFLLLGSASMDLLKQSGESLAGRIAYLEMAPFNTMEVKQDEVNSLWVRGGFPDSFLAKNDSSSLQWRQNFIRTFLERDIPQFGYKVPAETMRRFWTMLAHTQCTLLNASQIGRSLGIDSKKVASYIDLLVDLLLVRKLQPWHKNVGKRLVKSPKVFIRDSGIVHALLGISTHEDLLSHPIAGYSWEGFVIENLIQACPFAAEFNFYRTGAGAEIDLILTLPRGEVWAIEIKRGLSPKVEKGFYLACEDIQVTKKFIVYSGDEAYPLAKDIEVISLKKLLYKLQNQFKAGA